MNVRLKPGRSTIGAVAAMFLAASWITRAQAAPDPAKSASEATPGWTEMLDGLRDLPGRILARIPAEQRADDQVRQEAGRLALSALAAGVLDALASDPNHPVFLPQINNYLTIGQPNADTNYRSAKIAPGGTYRLRGRRGSMALARIAEAGPRPPQVPGVADLGAERPVHDLNALKIDGEGRYDVILSPARPAGHAGDWWRLDPTTDRLLVRMVGSDWSREVEPTLSIERLDRPASRPRLSAQALEARLRSVPTAATFIAPLLVDRPQKLRVDGYENRLKGVDLSRLGGMTGKFDYEGAYALRDDEALIVEAPLPTTCGYRSIMLVNDLYETIDWYNNRTSLNGSQASADADGILRIVVSARDPGVRNWLDTAGYATGVIQGRWTDCSSQPVPTVRKVSLSAVRVSLPKTTPRVTPQERERNVRDRRAALQQRPLW
ncbi:MAG: hypothetical protein ABW039_01960 [Sphingobium sp.]